jgi:hypothetical protein
MNLRADEVAAIRAALANRDTLRAILLKLPGVDPDDPQFDQFTDGTSPVPNPET